MAGEAAALTRPHAGVEGRKETRMKQVTRSLVTLLGGALVAAVVGGYAYWRSTSSAMTSTRDDRLVFDVALKRFDRIEIRSAGQLTALERDEGFWSVTRPERALADPQLVEEMLGYAVRIRAERRFDGRDGEPIPSTQATGIQDQDSTFVAWKEGEPSTRVKLVFGSASAFNGKIYALATQGEGTPELLMVAASNRSQVLRTAAQLYDRRLLGASFERVQAMTIEPREPSAEQIAFRFVATRDGADTPSSGGANTHYRITMPELGAADDFRIRELLKAFAAMPVSEFVTMEHRGEWASYGLDEPEFRVTATLLLQGAMEEERLVERKLRVGARRAVDSVDEVTIFVAREDQPWVGEVNRALLLALPSSEDQLKSKQLIDVDREHIHRIEMRLTEAGHLTVERTRPGSGKSSGWRMLAPEPGAVNAYVLNRFLLTFATLVGSSREAEGDAVRSPAVLQRTGLDPAQAQTITFLDDQGKVIGGLLLGAKDGEDLFVMAEGGPYIVRVPGAKARELPRVAADWLESAKPSAP